MSTSIKHQGRKSLITRPGHIALKRVIDTVLIVATAPLTLSTAAIAAVLVRVNLGRPVLFRQDRVGLDGNSFQLLKFRSMLSETDPRGMTLSDDERLTGFGRLLRRSSMDELPQLLNVLRGDMSLVGPRPLLVRYMPHYTETERVRHSVRPGITGAAQVSGRNFLDWDERLALDAKYAREATIVDDLEILWQTLERVVQRKDTGAEAWVLNEDFDIYRSYPIDAEFGLRRIEPRDAEICARWFRKERPPEVLGVKDHKSAAGVEAWMHTVRLNLHRKDLAVFDRSTRQLVAIAGYETDPKSSSFRIYFVGDPEQKDSRSESAALGLLVEFLKRQTAPGTVAVDLPSERERSIMTCQSYGFSIVGGLGGGDMVRLEATW